MMCVALKDFTGNGEHVIRNQLVDGEEFRNVQNLLTSRYLRFASQDEIENATVVEEEEPAPAPVVRKKKKGLRARVAKQE